MGSNLGRITVDLLAKTDQFEAGMAAAAETTAKFGSQVTRNSEQWKNAFERTDAQWNRYMSIPKKDQELKALGKSFRDLGQIVGPGLGGSFLRLAGSIDKALAAATKFGKLPAFSGPGTGSVGAAALTRGMPLVGAAAAGWGIGKAIDEGFADLQDLLFDFGGNAARDPNRRGLSGELGAAMYGTAKGIARIFGSETEDASGWRARYRQMQEGIKWTDEVNRKNRELREGLEREAQILTASLDNWRRYDEAKTSALTRSLAGGGSKLPIEQLTDALDDLRSATDTESKWDKLTRKIGEARNAIYEMQTMGSVAPAFLGEAERKLNEYAEKIGELQDAEGAKGSGISRDFAQVDSLTRLASGSPGGAMADTQRAQLTTLQSIDQGIRRLNRAPAMAGSN